MRIATCLCLFLLLTVSGSAWSQKPRPRQGDLKEGMPGPGFTIKDVDGRKTVKLADLRGKPVVLIFGSCT